MLSFEEIEKADKKFTTFCLGKEWKNILNKIDTDRDG